mgnify:FL=1
MPFTFDNFYIFLKNLVKPIVKCPFIIEGHFSFYKIRSFYSLMSIYSEGIFFCKKFLVNH